MTDYQRQSRPDLAVLHALSQSPDPVFFGELEIQVRSNEEWISAASIRDVLSECICLNYASPIATKGGAMYEITSKGRAHLCAADAKAIFGERVPTAPIRASCCHNRIEERIPDTALVCVDEDELDDWWDSLSIEMKADCFTGFALRMHDGSDSHVYVKGMGVPIAGFVDDLSPDLTEKLHNTESEAAR